MKSNFDCVVVGAGVSGMTSAIYLKRAGINVLLLEKSAPGGQINMSPSVENYPGFLKIDGATLAMNIFEQTQQLNIEYRYGNVLEIKKESEIFNIITDMETIKSKSVIIATGRNVMKLGLDQEETLLGKGISYCALCDANFFKDEIVSIIGNDYKTVEEAIYLSNICKSVILISKTKELDVDKVLLDNISNRQNIKICYNSIITKLNSEKNTLKSVTITNLLNKEIKEIYCSCLFISNGMYPNSGNINNVSKENNYLLVNNDMSTSIIGMYACGDVIKKDVYQLTTAIGEATIAATSVEHYLIGGKK